MSSPAYYALDALAREPEALEKTIGYLAEHLRKFMRSQERVLVCFPVHTPNSIGGIMEEAVKRVGAVPVIWGPDYRWKTLMKLAFSSRASAIIGPALVILGLTKVSKATGTPLYIRNVVTAGYHYEQWMLDAIRMGLDCNVWDCISPGIGALVAGFSCRHLRSIHIRGDVIGMEVVDEDGRKLPDGSIGQVVLFSRKDPSVRYPAMRNGWIETTPCVCGDPAARIQSIGHRLDGDLVLGKLGGELLGWSSILDCRLERGEFGLEMELVTFPGKKLPALPTCAKRVIRTWDPDRDTPFWIPPGWRKDLFPGNFY